MPCFVGQASPDIGKSRCRRRLPTEFTSPPLRRPPDESRHRATGRRLQLSSMAADPVGIAGPISPSRISFFREPEIHGFGSL